MKNKNVITKISQTNNHYYFTVGYKENNLYKCLVIEKQKPWNYEWKNISEMEYLSLNSIHWNQMNKHYLTAIKVQERLDKVLGEDFSVVNRLY